MTPKIIPMITAMVPNITTNGSKARWITAKHGETHRQIGIQTNDKR